MKIQNLNNFSKYTNDDDGSGYRIEYSDSDSDLNMNKSGNLNRKLYTDDDVYKMVQKIHHTYDDFVDGDLGDRIEKYSQYELRSISLADLDLDEWYVDEELVDEYVEKLQGLNEYPPIVVGYDDLGNYTIIDGIHRVNALSEAGEGRVNAFVGILNENM